MKPTAVLVHVHDVKKVLAWYQKAFPTATAHYMEAFDFTQLTIGDFSLEIVQADEKVSAGKCGTVLYWAVDNLDESLAHFRSLGATLYRGPMNIENGLAMCQVEDPFGNLIGLRGSLQSHQSKD